MRWHAYAIEHITYGHRGLLFPHPCLHNPISGQTPRLLIRNEFESWACLSGGFT